MKRLAAAIGVACLAMAGCSDPASEDAQRDESGEVVEADEIGVLRLRTGDCLLLPSETQAQVSTLEAVPCAEPHDAEVIGLHDMDGSDDAPFPGVDTVIAESEAVCLAMFDDVTGLDFVTDPFWNLTALYPTADSWERLDDREIVCIAVPLAGGTTTEPLPRV